MTGREKQAGEQVLLSLQGVVGIVGLCGLDKVDRPGRQGGMHHIMLG